jgi:hypothetical protein
MVQPGVAKVLDVSAFLLIIAEEGYRVADMSIRLRGPALIKSYG